MSKIITIGILCTLLTTTQAISQTQFWSDTFEDAGAPSSGTRTPTQNFSCGGPPATNYFFRTNTAGIALQAGTYSSMQGTKFWAGEDIDFGVGCVNSSISPSQQITWSGINISGKTGLSFRGLFAANGVSTGNWEGTAAGAAQDFIIVEYQIDGGGWNKTIQFASPVSTPAQQTLNRDANFDALGEGTALGYAFQEFTNNISGTGTTLDLRLTMSSNNSLQEEMAVDNFRLFYSSALPVTLTDFAFSCDTEYESVFWTVESEVRLDHYDIEASNDLQNFNTISTIKAIGLPNQLQTYEYIIPGDKKATYYRMKMVDTDGSFTYSSTISHNQCLKKQLLAGYSIQENQLVLSITIPFASAELITLTGQTLSGKINFGDETLQRIPLNSYGNQMFLLRITDSQTNTSEIYLIRI